MTTSALSIKNEGTASDADISSAQGAPSSLQGTVWNYQITFNNGNVGSGQFMFRNNGVCVIQQLKPNPTWWQVNWSENGGRFKMIEKGSNGAYGEYTGSHYNGKGSGTYFVYPADPSQDAVFTITKVS